MRGAGCLAQTVSDAHTFLVSGDRRHCSWVLQQFWISTQPSQKRWHDLPPCLGQPPGQTQGWKTEADSSKTDFQIPWAPCPLLSLNKLLLLEFMGILRRQEVIMSMDWPSSSCHHGWQPRATTGPQTQCSWTWPWDHCGLQIRAGLVVLSLLLARLPWLWP